MKISVEIKHIFHDANKAIKAYADIVMDNLIVIHNVSIVSGKNGLFVAMPRAFWVNKKGEEVSRDMVHPISSSAREKIHTAVIAAYNAATNNPENSKID